MAAVMEHLLVPAMGSLELDEDNTQHPMDDTENVSERSSMLSGNVVTMLRKRASDAKSAVRKSAIQVRGY